MRLLKYWQELRGVREFPTLSDINSEAIGDIWEHCYILDASANKEHPVFCYLGCTLAKYSGVYLRGQGVDATQHRTLLDQATRHFPDVIETRAPVTSEDEFLRYDAIKIIYRSIILPLSDDQQQVTHVLGAASGKEVD